MIRRECLDHVVVFGERHLRHVLLSYLKYHNEVRTHLSLEKDAPVSRTVERVGSILCHQFSAGYTINMFGFDLRQGQVVEKSQLSQLEIFGGDDAAPSRPRIRFSLIRKMK